jgi:voltage-gated potassium channel
MGSLQKKLYDLVEAPDNHVTSVQRYDWADIFLMALITLNVIAVIVESIPAVGREYHEEFYWFELFSVIVFSIEYCIRLAVCTEHPRYRHPVTGRLRFALSPLAIVDILAILPFYLPHLIAVDLRIMRLLRMFRFIRVLKFGRYSRSLQLIGRVLHAKKSDLITTIIVVVLLLTLSSSAMYLIENEEQPDAFTSIPMAMWWGIATLTTVGYGDVYPITALGKILAAIIALLGVGIFALPAGILASGFSEQIAEEKGKQAFDVCPTCSRARDLPPPELQPIPPRHRDGVVDD